MAYGSSLTAGGITPRYALQAKIKAEQVLAQHIADKYQPPRKRRGIEQIDIADVLSIYVDAALAVFRSRHGAAEGYEDTVPAVRKFQGRIDRLNDFWGGEMLAEVTGDNCRQIRRHTAATWLMQNSASR